MNGIEKRLFAFILPRLVKEIGFNMKDVDSITYRPKTGEVEITATMPAQVECIEMNLTIDGRKMDE